MRDYMPDKIRNIVVSGHSGSGKTSLAEALLFKTGATDRLGKVADGNTVCDYDPEEIKRRISVSLSVAPLEYKDYKINLIDTPGQFDFEGAFCEGFRAAETVLICVSGRSGCAVGTVKAFKAAKKAGKASVIFVSKLDAEAGDFMAVISALKAELGNSVCPIVMPITDGEKVTGYINVLENKAYAYGGKGERSETAMPAVAALEEIRGQIAEAVAETDDALMEKFFAGEEFTPEELAQGLRHGVKEGQITPVLCGSGYSLEGVDMLLDAIVNLTPSAHRAGGQKAVDKNGDEIMIECDDKAPLAAFVFKTIADPFVGKLSFFKVVAGALSGDIAPINARTGEPERLGKIIMVRGKKQEDVKAIRTGDIGAVTKLSCVTGDTLCDPSRVVQFAPITYPSATLSMSLKPKAKGDESKIAAGMQRLIEEDPTLQFGANAETHQQLITGYGEQHIDVAISKLKSKFSVDVVQEEPMVPYRETIRKKVKVQGRHKKQSGGHGQFGDVWIEFEPTDGDDLVFEEKVFGGSVPRNFFPAVEKGLRDSISHGTLAGYPLVGLKATLVDGSYHPVDSSEMSFKLAARIAYKTAIPQASPILLEPIGKLAAHVPDGNTGDLMGELNKRRGRVLGMSPDEDKLTCIEAEVPMSEMMDFTTFIRSLTQGRGWFTLTFERYEPLPQMLEAGVIEQAKKLIEEEKED